MRSCSQHAAAEKLTLSSLLKDLSNSTIYEPLSGACYELEELRMSKGGRKAYHTMAAAYFLDMKSVFEILKQRCREGAEICMMIGDSAPYGVHLPADQWLASLAEDAGLTFIKFEKIRDRNVKWKNRTHTVPLLEGRLWLVA